MGLDVLSLLEPVKIVQARVVYGDSLSRSISQLPHPTHFQVTARLVTRELPVTLPTVPSSTRPRKARRTTVSRSTGAAGGAASGVWRPVADGGSGHVYFWNQGSGGVEWETPTMLGVVGPDTPFSAPQAAADLTPIPDDVSGGGASHLRSEAFVTWERAATEGSVWQIAGWMP